MTRNPGRPAPIPQPRPFEPERPVYSIPPPPGLVHVVRLAQRDGIEIAAIAKRTYDWYPGAFPVPAEQQPPLLDTMVSHDGADPGMASPKYLPEIVGFKTGTDVVVHGSARPSRPVREMMAGIRVDAQVHAVKVFGRRLVEHGPSGVRFGIPEPFEAVALRYENAYGGRDQGYERAFAAEFQEAVDPAAWRRARTNIENAFGRIHPLMYPRNRFGKGYVLGDDLRKAVGRELPNIELPRDLLTPERLACNPMRWQPQPIPAGVGYLDPFSFPRSALMGMSLEPPPTADGIREVAMGLVPGMPTRGILTATPEQMGDVVHPAASRCASLGLWLPFLHGDESVVIHGMDAGHPALPCPLPDERPMFHLGIPVEPEALTPPQVYLVRIDVDRRQLVQVWVQRFRHPRPADGGFVASAAQTAGVVWRRDRS